MKLQSINPSTAEVVAEYEGTSSEEAGRIIERCHDAFLEWKQLGFADRAKPLREVARILRRSAGDFAFLMAREMGKLVSQGRQEVEKCAWACEYFAENAQGMLADEEERTDATKSYVTFQPLGVILAVMPWNFPFWQVFRFAAPALMAGNGVVVKHASNVPGCAQAIETLCQEAGFPKDLVRTVFVPSEEVDRLMEHALVRAVTLTGSSAAGRSVARKAGSLLKKAVLELGGSDPYIILEDAHLPSAVTTCVDARLINSGQSCIAAKRFVVVEPVREDFERLFVERMRAKKVGDPLREETEVGPLARHDLRESLHRQVTKSVEVGARLLLGGSVPEGNGAYYPPTVLTDVRKGMPAYEEELFGPVAAIIPARDERDAVRIANDSVYGLGAAVLTRDSVRGERIAARELESGACFVNAQVKSDPRLPFGGMKESGYGRELSRYGIKEFVNVKTVVVR